MSVRHAEMRAAIVGSNIVGYLKRYFLFQINAVLSNIVIIKKIIKNAMDKILLIHFNIDDKKEKFLECQISILESFRKIM